MKLLENYYLTGAGEVVFENDHRGRTLIGRRGDEISEEDAAKYGILADGKLAAPQMSSGVIEQPQSVRAPIAAKRRKT